MSIALIFRQDLVQSLQKYVVAFDRIAAHEVRSFSVSFIQPRLELVSLFEDDG